MLRQAAAGLTGLGLIGGAGAVAYDDDGTAKVTIKDKQGRTQSVEIGGAGGKSFMCPDGTEAMLEPIDIQAGRIKTTLRQVRKTLNGIEKRYPGGEAPGTVVDRYNRLGKREGRLVDAYNEAIGKHNAVIESECERAS